MLCKVEKSKKKDGVNVLNAEKTAKNTSF